MLTPSWQCMKRDRFGKWPSIRTGRCFANCSKKTRRAFGPDEAVHLAAIKKHLQCCYLSASVSEAPPSSFGAYDEKSKPPFYPVRSSFSGVREDMLSRAPRAKECVSAAIGSMSYDSQWSCEMRPESNPNGRPRARGAIPAIRQANTLFAWTPFSSIVGKAGPQSANRHP